MYTRKKKQKRNDNTNYRFPRSRETTSLSAASFSSFFKSNEERQVTRLRKKTLSKKLSSGTTTKWRHFPTYNSRPLFLLSCVCVFFLNKKTSQLNRFVLSSADGHDAKTLRVHQRVVANDLNVVFPYHQMCFRRTILMWRIKRMHKISTIKFNKKNSFKNNRMELFVRKKWKFFLGLQKLIFISPVHWAF